MTLGLEARVVRKINKWGSYAGGSYVVAATLAVSAVVTLVLSRWPGQRFAVPPAP